MLNRFQGWRERGWSPVDASTYASAWQRFGGSVATHPLVVERLAQLAGMDEQQRVQCAGLMLERLREHFSDRAVRDAFWHLPHVTELAQRG